MPYNYLEYRGKQHELTELGDAVGKGRRLEVQGQWDWQSVHHEQEGACAAVSDLSPCLNKDTTLQEARQNFGNSPTSSTTSNEMVPQVSCEQDAHGFSRVLSKMKKDPFHMHRQKLVMVTRHDDKDHATDGFLLNTSGNCGHWHRNKMFNCKEPVTVATTLTFDFKESVAYSNFSEETDMLHLQKDQQNQLHTELKDDLSISFSSKRDKSCVQDTGREASAETVSCVSEQLLPECTTSVSDSEQPVPECTTSLSVSEQPVPEYTTGVSVQPAQMACYTGDNNKKHHTVFETIAEINAVNDKIQRLRRGRKKLAMSSEEKVQMKGYYRKMHSLRKALGQQKRCQTMQNNLCSHLQRAVGEAWSPETVPESTTCVLEQQAQADCIIVNSGVEHSTSETVGELQVVADEMQQLMRGRKREALSSEEKVQFKDYKKKMRKLRRAHKRQKRCQSVPDLCSQLQQLQRQTGGAGSGAVRAEATKNGIREQRDACSEYYSERAKLTTELAAVICKIKTLKCSKKKIKGGARQKLKELTKQENQLKKRLAQIHNCENSFSRENYVGIQGMDPFSALGKVSRAFAVWRQKKHTEACLVTHDLQLLDLQHLLGDKQDQQKDEDVEIVEIKTEQEEQESEIIVVSDEEVDQETRQSYSYLASKYLVNRTQREWRQQQKQENKRKQQQQIAIEIDRCVKESRVVADVNQSYFLISGLASVLLSQQRRLKQVQHSDQNDFKDLTRLGDSSLNEGEGLGPYTGGWRLQGEWGQQEDRQESMAMAGTDRVVAGSKEAAACCHLIAKIVHQLKMTPQQCLGRNIVDGRCPLPTGSNISGSSNNTRWKGGLSSNSNNDISNSLEGTSFT